MARAKDPWTKGLNDNVRMLSLTLFYVWRNEQFSDFLPHFFVVVVVAA